MFCDRGQRLYQALARRGRTRWVAIALFALAGCGRCGGEASHAVGKFDGGVVTEEELRREADRLPPTLRAQFDSEAGRRDLLSALVDRKLLAREAERLKLENDPEIRRQVTELQERLVIQALLAQKDRAASDPSEGELRAWYDAHVADLRQPERIRVRRVFVAAQPPGSSVERAARGRLEGLVRRVRAGEPFERVAAAGDGAERSRGGELALLVHGSVEDRALERVAFGLRAPHELSPVFACEGGLAVVQLLERREGRTPPFKEVRAEVANRMAPERKRRAFDALIRKLRNDANVKIEVARR